MKENEEILQYVKNEEEPVFEENLKKEMEACFTTVCGDVRHERSLTLILSLTDPDIIKQSTFTDHETNIIKNLAVEKLHKQECSKEIFALQILEQYFLSIKYWHNK